MGTENQKEPRDRASLDAKLALLIDAPPIVARVGYPKLASRGAGAGFRSYLRCEKIDQECLMEAKVRTNFAPLAVLTLLSVAAAPSLAARPGFGLLYYNDDVVRTVVPPAAAPLAGRDNFYAVTDGVEDQLGIAGVAPGALDYHGGQWAFHSVVWNVTPYLLTSEAAVFFAAAAGDVTVTRLPENDFKCPVQP